MYFPQRNQEKKCTRQILIINKAVLKKHGSSKTKKVAELSHS